MSKNVIAAIEQRERRKRVWATKRPVREATRPKPKAETARPSRSETPST